MIGLYMVEEEEKVLLQNELNNQKLIYNTLQKKFDGISNLLSIEEDAKRRMLLRYIHSIKENAMLLNNGTGGILTLPESNISDEEVHALAALLRNNQSIDEVNLRNNNITDDGARALGAVVSSRTNIRLLDLRGNKISESAIRLLGENLQRSERIRHVYIHKNGKIEGLGAGRWAQPRSSTEQPNNSTDNLNTSNTNTNVENTETNESKVMVTVETICVIDVRDNNPNQTNNFIDSIDIDIPQTNISKSITFQPLDLLDHKTDNKLDRSISPYKQSLSPSPLNIKNKMNTKTKLPILLNNETNFIDDKKKLKSKDEKLMEIRENLWQGRAGGLDKVDTADNNIIKKKRNNNNSSKLNQTTSIDFQLPKLIDVDSNMNDLSNRGKTAPPTSIATTSSNIDFFNNKKPDSATEAIVRDVLIKAKKTKGIRSMKTSETEKRLFNSPFAQSVVKYNEKNSP